MMELLQLNPAASSHPVDFDLEEYISAEFLDTSDTTPITGELDLFLASLHPYRSTSDTPGTTTTTDTAPDQQPTTTKRGRPRKDSDTDPAPYPTSSAEKSRRERNRLAAQRCRERRLARVEELEAEVEQLRREKEAMMAELIRLGGKPPC